MQIVVASLALLYHPTPVASFTLFVVVLSVLHALVDSFVVASFSVVIFSVVVGGGRPPCLQNDETVFPPPPLRQESGLSYLLTGLGKSKTAKVRFADEKQNRFDYERCRVRLTCKVKGRGSPPRRGNQVTSHHGLGVLSLVSTSVARNLSLCVKTYFWLNHCLVKSGEAKKKPRF